MIKTTENVSIRTRAKLKSLKKAGGFMSIDGVISFLISFYIDNFNSIGIVKLLQNNRNVYKEEVFDKGVKKR